MSDSQSSEGGLPLIPDDLTLAQFMLDYQHNIQPVRGKIPCLVDDVSGRNIDLEMVYSPDGPEVSQIDLRSYS